MNLNRRRRIMSAATLTNGKPRKQLSDQLDRLDTQMDRADTILDALSEGLNGAVADATKEGTRLAIKDAVIELLTDPELRAALHKASAPPAPAKPSLWARLRERAKALAAKAKAAGLMAATAVAARAPAVRRGLATAAGYGRFAWHVKKVLLVGLGVGAVVAAVSYLGGHHLAAALSGVGAAVTTVAVRAGLWVRRTIHRLVPA
jgi:hypothetical protein